MEWITRTIFSAVVHGVSADNREAFNSYVIEKKYHPKIGDPGK